MRNLNAIRQEFESLKHPDGNADSAWYRQRGKRFEQIICDLLEREGLKPRTSYRPEGEEIDGSFEMDRRTFLLEAKWHSDKLPASTIYAFKGKVDGKLVGTVGVFISVSGYSESAVDALRLGKELNVILFDGDDFEACLEEDRQFTKILRLKLRRAAETGEIYYPYSVEKVLGEPNDVVLIVEGRSDQIVVSQLSERVLQAHGITRQVEVIPAMGKVGIINVAHSVPLSAAAGAKIVIIADSDGSPEDTEKFFNERLWYSMQLIIVHPSIESWLFPGERAPREELQEIMRRTGLSREQAILRLLSRVDLHTIERSDASFREFVRLLTM